MFYSVFGAGPSINKSVAESKIVDPYAFAMQQIFPIFVSEIVVLFGCTALMSIDFSRISTKPWTPTQQSRVKKCGEVRRQTLRVRDQYHDIQRIAPGDLKFKVSLFCSSDHSGYPCYLEM